MAFDQDNPQAEISAMRAAGIRFIVPIASPGYEHVSDVSSAAGNTGIRDGNGVCRAILDTASRYGLFLPDTSLKCIIYLDVEDLWNLSPAYWKSWSNTVATFSGANNLAQFLPGVYCNPTNNVARVCNVIDPGTPVWSSQPNNDSDCNRIVNDYWFETYRNIVVEGGSRVSEPAPVGCPAGSLALWQYAGDWCRSALGAARADWPEIDFDSTDNYTVLTRSMRIV